MWFVHDVERKNNGERVSNVGEINTGENTGRGKPKKKRMEVIRRRYVRHVQ